LGAYLALQELKEKRKGVYRYSLTQGVEMGKKSDILVEVWRGYRETDESYPIESIILSGTAVQVMEGTLEI
jgi:predicted PhzF superfamily epimerase YddE/YHI9